MTALNEPDDFALPAGAPFAKVFETKGGQILATLEANEDGNAAVVLRMWTDEGLADLTLGVAGVRSCKTDATFADNFAHITAERALDAFRLALS